MKVPALSDWRLFMTKIHKTKSTLVMSVIIMLLLLLPQTAYAADGTDGTEMQVLQPQQLEIQLGSNWAGVEFQLKTDAGLYPGTISVGEDGVLRLEIGGSSTYTLTCLNLRKLLPRGKRTRKISLHLPRKLNRKVARNSFLRPQKNPLTRMQRTLSQAFLFCISHCSVVVC